MVIIETIVDALIKCINFSQIQTFKGSVLRFTLVRAHLVIEMTFLIQKVHVLIFELFSQCNNQINQANVLSTGQNSNVDIRT